MICGNFNTTNYTAISCVLMAEKKQGTSAIMSNVILYIDFENSRLHQLISHYRSSVSKTAEKFYLKPKGAFCLLRIRLKAFLYSSEDLSGTVTAPSSAIIMAISIPKAPK